MHEGLCTCVNARESVGSDPLLNMAGGDVSEADLDGCPGGALQRGAAAAGRLALHHLLLLTGAPFAQAVSQPGTQRLPTYVCLFLFVWVSTVP